MARWKLMTPHYLNVIGTEWEYQEIDRKTNKQVRRRFPVPQLLDPRDPSCWTTTWGSKGDEDGEVIVCLPGKGTDRDIEFFADSKCTQPGSPTPDMVPIDDEAKEISASFAGLWAFKPETDDISYSQSLVDKFQAEMAEKEAKPTEVQIAGLDQLMAQMAASQAMMAEAMKLMASNSRRV